MRFHPVWLSTPELLTAYTRIVGKATFFQRLFGNYNVMSALPHLHNTVKNKKAPLGFFSFGTLVIEGESLQYAAETPKDRDFIYRHCRQNLNFDLTLDRVVSMDKFEFKSPMMKYALPMWTHIKSDRDDLTKDLLIGVAGDGGHGKLVELFENMHLGLITAYSRRTPKITRRAPAATGQSSAAGTGTGAGTKAGVKTDVNNIAGASA